MICTEYFEGMIADDLKKYFCPGRDNLVKAHSSENEWINDLQADFLSKSSSLISGLILARVQWNTVYV